MAGLGVLSAIPEADGIVADLGGGSTELVWIDLSAVPPEDRPNSIMRLHRGFQAEPGGARVVDWISVPLGVATLKDQFQDVEDDAARFALMSWFFEENLASFSPYNSAQRREGFQIIGTSGTVTTVAASPTPRKINAGVISAPPPIPVSPTTMPTKNPAARIEKKIREKLSA